MSADNTNWQNLANRNQAITFTKTLESEYKFYDQYEVTKSGSKNSKVANASMNTLLQMLIPTLNVEIVARPSILKIYKSPLLGTKILVALSFRQLKRFYIPNTLSCSYCGIQPSGKYQLNQCYFQMKEHEMYEYEEYTESFRTKMSNCCV